MTQSEVEYSMSKRRQTRFKGATIIATLVALAFLAAFIVVLVLYLKDKASALLKIIEWYKHVTFSGERFIR